MLLGTAAVPAFAQTSGGAGGAVLSPGGTGGASSATGNGANGGIGVFDSGGGGGGAGAAPQGINRRAGDGGDADGGAPGGSGAFFAGGSGGPGLGPEFVNLGAGGGGGGVAGTLITTTGIFTVPGNSVGGDGGNGGTALGVGGGGGGGAAGFGISVAASPVTLQNGETITGGNGGIGGNGDGTAGNGGDGGIGVYFAAGAGTLINSGSISGGAGGAGGMAPTPGTAGANGPGVEGANLSITNSGTIAGASGNGTQANAIIFTGGANTLTLESGSTLIGNIEIDGGGSLTFNQSTAQTLGSAIIGNGSVIQAGAGTLTLTGVNTYTGGTTVNAGALALGPGGSLLANAALTIDGGSFNLNGNDQTVGQLSGTAGTIALGAGTLTVNQSSSTYFGGTINGTGSLVISGTGALQLNTGSTYSGGTTLSGGTLGIGGPGSLGTGPLTIAASSIVQLDFNFFSLANPIVIQSGVAATFYTSGTATLSGVISGGGTLVKTGTAVFGPAPPLYLNAAETYTGPTIVNSGTLAIGPEGSISRSSGVDLAAAGTTFDISTGGNQTIGDLAGVSGALVGLASNNLTAGTANSTTFLGDIVGNGGSFAKVGSGTLTLDGENSYTGMTTVSDGTLELGDDAHPAASLAGPVTVGPAGILMGHGTVGGAVTNAAGGTVAPGGTIGTLTVGSYTQGVSSTLLIEVSPSAASKLAVTGNAALAGTIALAFDPGNYAKETYDIVHASSVTGTFSTITTSAAPAGFAESLSYTSTDVDLTLDPAAIPEDSVFTALSSATLLTAQEANASLLRYLDDLHSGIGSATTHTSNAPTAPRQIAQGGGDLSGIVANLPDAVAQMGGWFRAIGDFASLSGSRGMSGFDTQGGGFIAGIDRQFADGLTAGIAGGYSRTDVSQGSGMGGTVDTPRLWLYGSYEFARWGIDGTMGYAYDRIGVARPVPAFGATASSSHDGHEANAALQARTRLTADGIVVLPVVGLEYVHLYETAFGESGAGTADVALAGRNSDSLRPFTGVSAAKAFTLDNGLEVASEVDINYSHEIFGAAPSILQMGGGSFSVDDLVPSHDRLTAGASVTAKMSDRFALYADYQTVLPTGNLFQQTVSGGFQYRF